MKEPENGFFTPYGDTKAIEQKILHVLDNPKLRKEIADNGYALYKKEFTPKAVGRKLIEFVQEIL